MLAELVIDTFSLQANFARNLSQIFVLTALEGNVDDFMTRLSHAELRS